MGCFSWCTSDTRKSIPCGFVNEKYEGAPETVYLLNPFGEPYKESAYEGYGEFGGRDVFDLVVEWNRKYLTPDNLPKPDRSHWANDEHGEKAFQFAFERYMAKCSAIKEYAAGASDEYMKEHYGTLIGYGDGSDWKRCLGISLACYDEDHVKLKYPIKIVEHLCAYDEAEISPSCPFQGCFYETSPWLIQQQIDEAFDKLDAAEMKYLKSLKDKMFDSLESKIASAEKQMADVSKSNEYKNVDRNRD